MKTVLNLILVFALTMPLVNGVFAQSDIKFPESCCIKGPKYGPDSVEGVKNLSLYRENYKQWRDSKFKGEAINYTIGPWSCLLYTSDAAEDLLCVDLGGSRIIKKKN